MLKFHSLLFLFGRDWDPLAQHGLFCSTKATNVYLSASLSVCVCALFFYLSSWRNWINVQWISRSLCRRCIIFCCCIVWVWMSVSEPNSDANLNELHSHFCYSIHGQNGSNCFIFLLTCRLASSFACIKLLQFTYSLLIWFCCYVCACVSVCRIFNLNITLCSSFLFLVF